MEVVGYAKEQGWSAVEGYSGSLLLNGVMAENFEKKVALNEKGEAVSLPLVSHSPRNRVSDGQGFSLHENGVTEELITEPLRYPFDLQIPTNVSNRENRLNTHENTAKVALSKAEIRDQIRRCIQTENLDLQQTADRVGISVITVRRISRTLKLGPYREIGTSAIRPKSSQTPYGWTRLNGIIERNPSEWKWVELAFKLHRDGTSLHKIAAHLNVLNVPSKNGGTWSAKTISQTLKWNEPHLKQPRQRR